MRNGSSDTTTWAGVGTELAGTVGVTVIAGVVP